MIIYIHGFSSSENSVKGQILKNYFAGKEKVLTPGLPEEPNKTIKILEELIDNSKGENVMLIGSSLGGFYALAMHSKYENLKTVLINPALFPWEQLKPYVGMNISKSNGQSFEWKAEYLEQLRKQNDDIGDKKSDKIMLLLAKDDELIDYKNTMSLLGKTGELIVLENAGHQFSRFDEVLENIYEFFRRNS